MAIRISDIYAGKPDARDEIDTEGYESFIDTFIVPPNFDIDALVTGSYYFITGYKGTGKTALLYYLDNYIKSADPVTCSSFVFFKGDYSDIKRQEFELLSKRLLSSISIEDNVILDGQDFEYIWRWLFYQRIINDNDTFNEGLFEPNNVWVRFENVITKISLKSGKKRLIIPPKLKFSVPINEPSTMTTFSPELELDFLSRKSTETEAYRQFVKAIDEADILFSSLTRTDIPYYIFIDELEAYFGDENIFKRDLRLIRDLIFTIKKLNGQFSLFPTKTKIICSIRTEILNAINRFIVTKELNKVTSGFEVPLVWDYTNTNSFAHPIMKILIKRIELSEKIYGAVPTEKEIIAKWFPEKIRGIEPANYILNNSWCKPRDIVRFILAAKSCLCSTNSSFSQATCEMCHKKYSLDSLTEIKEEMRALYSPEQIDCINTCLTGFRAVFSIRELEERISKHFKDSILSEDLNSVLQDLYRLGIIGNYLKNSKLYRWQHRGNDGLIISDEWDFMIHQALQSALSVSIRHDHGMHRLHSQPALPQKGELYDVVVSHTTPGFVIVDFQKGGFKYRGSVHISQLSSNYVLDTAQFASPGDHFKAKVLEFNEQHQKWVMTFKL